MSDPRASSLPVRLLAYSLVPGMSINSPLFHKAVAVIAKQQHTVQPPVSAPGTSTLGAIDPSLAQAAFGFVKGKKKRSNGKSISPFNLLSESNPFNLLDPLIQFINGPDRELIAHARDVVTNSTRTPATS
jgi:hypothetical protein